MDQDTDDPLGSRGSSDDTIPYGDPFAALTQYRESSQSGNGDAVVDRVTAEFPLRIEIPAAGVSMDSFATESKPPSQPALPAIGLQPLPIVSLQSASGRSDNGSHNLLPMGDDRTSVGKDRKVRPGIYSSSKVSSNPGVAVRPNRNLRRVVLEQSSRLFGGLGLWTRNSIKKRRCVKRVFIGHQTVFFESVRNEYFPSLSNHSLGKIRVCDDMLPFEVSDFVSEERYRMVSQLSLSHNQVCCCAIISPVYHKHDSTSFSLQRACFRYRSVSIKVGI